MAVIEVKDLAKRFLIQKIKNKDFNTLRDVLAGGWRRQKEYFWALRGLNFSVQRGEVIGLIGPNGSGKSTLLKILSRITPPTKGEVIIRGRVASVLEVGTGFHPELTGRENIYLNGAILGMRKKDIDRKFTQIVEFSEVEKFIDMPVKYYSSGMYTRIAFAVVAFLENDILFIDEVLAVGDLKFQKKSLAKMKALVSDGQRTIIFVSHNMDMIRQIASRCIFLKAGRIAGFGPTDEIVAQYLSAIPAAKGSH